MMAQPRSLSNSTWSGQACPPLSGVAAEVGLPLAVFSKLNVFMTSVEAHDSPDVVARCCSPSTLNVADGCTMWCEMPSRFMSLRSKQGDTKALTAMTDCIKETETNWTGYPSILVNSSAASGGKGGQKTILAVWALLIVSYTVAII